MKRLASLLAILVIFYAVGVTYNLFPKIDLERYLPALKTSTPFSTKQQTVVDEESTITKVVEKTLPSVVTVGIKKTTQGRDSITIDPSNPFLPFRRIPGKQQQVEANIGSGFIVSADGLIITNRHVVGDTNATYTVLTNDKKEYAVQRIYRDPLNDLAILKITPPAGEPSLKPLELGDSSKLKLGQIAIAIGTPLGEFTNTVTAGIISGLGRGITAGSPFEGYVEKLDNVIQTDAAISAGNSGGPLLNSGGQVIGINTAIAGEAQNIGFAIPVNVVRDLIDNFNRRGGSFDRPYIGVRYKILDKTTAVQNELVEGAYVIEVLPDSPAQKAGIQEEDIITEFDGKRVNGSDDQALAREILERRIGDRVNLKIWRGKQVRDIQLTLEASQ